MLAPPRLPVAERGASKLINQLGVLLKIMGQLEEARPLYEEALQACRETLGDRHSDTLISISNMGMFLQDMGRSWRRRGRCKRRRCRQKRRRWVLEMRIHCPLGAIEYCLFHALHLEVL